jgi:hypothetical protein
VAPRGYKTPHIERGREPKVGRAVVRSREDFLGSEAEHKARARIAGERAGEAKARRRIAEARASESEARAARARDAQPTTSGPRGKTTSMSKPRRSDFSKALDRTSKRFLRLGSANPRRVLMLELVAVLTIQTVRAVAGGTMPTPRNYVAPFIVYLILSFAAELGGDGGARIATGFGALVLVAILMVNAPEIARAIQVATGQTGGVSQVAQNG